ncbi:uncharacterized protein LOC134262968 [Saccostrea cucullata]|uniref:uncharacterized protein LOC134262968 n=1 Tax=Saccostrea cuccullata TaxID=36930 RepID=UPI002ED4B029
MIFNFILVLVYQLQEDISAQTDKETCRNLDGTFKCCSGYYSYNNSCIECFGAFGENCSTECVENFYGYRCSEICNCKPNQVCNKYVGCQVNDNYSNLSASFNEQEKGCGESGILILVIGLGSATLSASLVFVGIMFCRWRIHLQSTFKISEDNTSGFRVDLLSFPGKQEIYQETYDDVRESKMSLDGKKNEERATAEYRINSTGYNQLFNYKNNAKKKPDKEGGEGYASVDARYQRESVLVTLSEFPGDDCYASIPQNAKRLRRISKSCSDLKAVTSKPYVNTLSNNYDDCVPNMSEKAVLIEHL